MIFAHFKKLTFLVQNQGRKWYFFVNQHLQIYNHIYQPKNENMYFSCLLNVVFFLSYLPGDVVVIMPQNSLETVTEFINHMKLKDDNFFHIQQQDLGKL